MQAAVLDHPAHLGKRLAAKRPPRAGILSIKQHPPANRFVGLRNTQESDEQSERNGPVQLLANGFHVWNLRYLCVGSKSFSDVPRMIADSGCCEMAFADWF